MMSHDKATWTKGLCTCDFTQWEIMNFAHPVSGIVPEHTKLLNLEATLWHGSGNLFSSDIWSFYTNI